MLIPCPQLGCCPTPQMTLYSSVVADGAGSQLRMGLVAATGGGWAGCARRGSGLGMDCDAGRLRSVPWNAAAQVGCASL